jgi:hypothetical protein
MPKGVYEHKKNRVITWGDKISKSLTGRSHSEEHKLNNSIGHMGIASVNKGVTGVFRHTEESKKKIGIASTGRQHMRGRHLSAVTCEKLRVKNTGRKRPVEATRKTTLALTGRKRPDMVGKNNPMHTHPNAYKSKFGKTGFREDLGIFVKSSWEANMLRIFRYLGLNVQYEPQSFKLSDGRTYRPDFYIHETEELIEVKGRWIGDAFDRFSMFKQEYPCLSIDLIEEKEYKEYVNEFKNIISLEGQ